MQREILHLTPDDARRTAWKDGGGVTEELAIWPQDAELARMDFDWRISKSRVERDGPFSAFDGYDRTLVITEGAGLVLAHAESSHRSRLRALEPLRFDGGWATRAELVAGPVADFNVFARRDTVHAEVQVTRIAARRMREWVGPGDAFVHVLTGSLTARVPREESPFDLQCGDSLWVHDVGAPEELELLGRDAETRVVLVRVEPLG